jgi:hypothetical protein
LTPLLNVPNVVTTLVTALVKPCHVSF